MEAHAITVITPTVRPEGLEVVAKCLRRQDFRDFEWLIAAPEAMRADVEAHTASQPHVFVPEPPKIEGDFWCLNKAWNKAFALAQGKLLVSIQDLIWFPPDLLSRFWHHYLNNPKALVTVVGHQYSDLDSLGKPVNLVWSDPRVNGSKGSFFEVQPSEMEMAVCSIPRQAVVDCGGLDEVYDTCPAMGEKEMCFRLLNLGYEFYQDQSIEYRAVKHGRLTEDWDDKYWNITAPLFKKHIHDLMEGTRPLKVHCLERYNVDT